MLPPPLRDPLRDRPTTPYWLKWPMWGNECRGDQCRSKLDQFPWNTSLTHPLSALCGQKSIFGGSHPPPHALKKVTHHALMYSIWGKLGSALHQGTPKNKKQKKTLFLWGGSSPGVPAPDRVHEGIMGHQGMLGRGFPRSTTSAPRVMR